VVKGERDKLLGDSTVVRSIFKLHATFFVGRWLAGGDVMSGQSAGAGEGKCKWKVQPDT
jgi:hypothetical protein